MLGGDLGVPHLGGDEVLGLPCPSSPTESDGLHLLEPKEVDLHVRSRLTDAEALPHSGTRLVQARTSS